MRRVLAVPFASLCILMWTGQAGASPVGRDSPALSWVRMEGAERCISGPDLAEGVERHWGKAAFVSASQATINIEGRIEPDARHRARWVATLVASDAGGKVLGHRRLELDALDCRAVDEALTLVIALAFDSELGFVALPEGFGSEDAAEALQADVARATMAEPARDPLAATSEVTRERPAPPERREARARHTDAWRLLADVGVAGSAGPLPALGFGMRAGLEVTREPGWAARLGVQYLLPRGEAPVGGGEVTLSALGVRLAGCAPGAGWNQLELRLCAGPELGLLFVTGNGLRERRNVARWLAGGGADLDATWPRAARYRLRVTAGLSVPVVRDSIQVITPAGNPRQVFRMAPVLGNASIGLVAALGP